MTKKKAVFKSKKAAYAAVAAHNNHYEKLIGESLARTFMLKRDLEEEARHLALMIDELEDLSLVTIDE